MTGSLPSVAPRNGSRYLLSTGASTYRPHRPYTTLGIAASRSTSTVSGLRIHPLRTSFSSSARPTEIGSARTMAIVDVTSVP